MIHTVETADELTQSLVCHSIFCSHEHVPTRHTRKQQPGVSNAFWPASVGTSICSFPRMCFYKGLEVTLLKSQLWRRHRHNRNCSRMEKFLHIVCGNTFAPFRFFVGFALLTCILFCLLFSLARKCCNLCSLSTAPHSFFLSLLSPWADWPLRGHFLLVACFHWLSFDLETRGNANEYYLVTHSSTHCVGNLLTHPSGMRLATWFGSMRK